MSASIKDITHANFPAIELSNEKMSTIVIPRLGAKIASLRSLESGREWLWSNPHLPLAEPQYRGPYTEKFDSGGWDELLPTIDACEMTGTPWAGQRLTDHGELWYRDWQVVEREVMEDDGAVILVMETTGDPFPFKLRRTLRLESESATLTAQYRLENLGEVSLPYVWACHALFKIEPGMKIELPLDTSFRTTAMLDFELESPGVMSWPTMRWKDGNEVDLSVMPDPRDRSAAGFATMLITERLSEGWVALKAVEGGEMFRFHFDKDMIPRVGLWQNRNKWSGCESEPYYNLGIEPMTGPTVSLSDSVAAGNQFSVEPGGVSEWVLVAVID